MDLKELHLLAKNMTFSEFETEVRNRIDKVLPTVKSDNEYVVVNKNAVSRDVSKRSELLIGLLTILEKEGGNNFIDKAEIVAKYEANL